ncbi:MAG: PspA/IM30 family protein [Rhodobacterales bacterium]|nr:PspA/IM30 family protein [Rhodobacterales bacterium]
MSILTRSYNVVRGLIGNVVLWFERRNPDALLENEKENLRRLMTQFNTGLVQHAALSERLTSQIARGEKQIETLTYRVKALLGSGERDAAAREALALKDARAQLDEDRLQQVEAETTFKNLVARRDTAVAETRARIEQVRRQIGDLKVKRAIADLEGMAQAMVGDLDSGGASLNRLEEMITEERDKAGARARVAQSAAGTLSQATNDTVRQAMADAALAEFLGPGPRALPDMRHQADVLPDPIKSIPS